MTGRKVSDSNRQAEPCEPPPSVLVVCAAAPYPTKNGDAVRHRDILAAVGRAHVRRRLRAVAIFDHTDGSARAYVKEHCPVPAIVGSTDGLTRTAVNKFYSIAIGVPPWIDGLVCKDFGATTRRQSGYDVVLVLGEASARYIAEVHSPRSVIVWDKSNVLAASQSRTGRWANARTALAHTTASRYEALRLKRADRVVVTSLNEARKLEGALHRTADQVVPSGVDTAPFRRISAKRPSSPTIGWLGRLDYSANSDGLRRFITEGGLDLIGRDVVLEVVGSGLAPRDLVDLCAKDPRVRLRGFVEDLTSWLHTLRAGVVPLWSGAGVKLKTVTFLAAGVPIVGTGVALEGVASIDDAIVMHDNVSGLSNGLTQLLEMADDEWADASQRLMQMAFQKHDATAIYDNYVDQLLQWHCDRGIKPLA